MRTQILDMLPIGVLFLDAELRVCFLNRTLTELTGYNVEEATGINADHILRAGIATENSSLSRTASYYAKQMLAAAEKSVHNATLLNRSRCIIPVRLMFCPLAGEREKQIMIVVERLPKTNGSKQENASSTMIGKSLQMQQVFEKMAVFAKTDASVLITGETGCGKDLLAEELHTNSARANRPFIKVNCGALPEALLESELFGHKRGAFTGAVNDHPGMFRLANKGSLFLTEIGDLSLPLQVKLLSVLDDRKFFPIGSTTQVSVDIRLIAATHRNLRKEVAEGRFREDLFFRLNVLHLEIPPLRDRVEDLRLLLEHFLKTTAKTIGADVRGFEAETLSFLHCCRWEGNVRELRNVVEYAVTMAKGTRISLNDLPDYLTVAAMHEREQREENRDNFFPASPAMPAFLPQSQVTWAESEKQNILYALQQTGGRKGDAAQLLGMGRTTLWRKIKQYRLDMHDAVSGGEHGE